MKGRFGKLTISAYGSRFSHSSTDLSFATCKSFIVDGASEEEKRINKYLDANNIFLIDIKILLED